jgi:hypothetical protein
MRHLADSLFYRLDSLRPPLMFCLVLIGFLSVCAFVGALVWLLVFPEEHARAERLLIIAAGCCFGAYLLRNSYDAALRRAFAAAKPERESN